MRIPSKRRPRSRPKPVVTINENPSGSKTVRFSVTGSELHRDPETGHYTFYADDFFLDQRFEVEPDIFLRVRVKISIEAEPGESEARLLEALLLSRKESCVIPQ